MTIKTKREAWFWIVFGFIAQFGWLLLANEHHLNWILKFAVGGFLGAATWFEGVKFLWIGGSGE